MSTVWMRTVMILVALCAVAHANPAAAEKVYRDGKALFAAGKTAEACAAFRRSQELQPRVGTLLNLGECEEKLGRFASAWVAFVDARSLATRLSDARATLADERAAALAPRLAYVTLKTPAGEPPAGLAVRRNELDVPAAELEIEVPLDPGHYDFEVRAPGFKPWNHSLDLWVGQRATLDIPALVVDPDAPASALAGKPVRIVTSHRVGIGGAVGASHEGNLTFGVRIPLHIAPLGSTATLRAVPSVFYRKRSYDDVFHKVEVYSMAIAVEYVVPVTPKLVFATGLGLGIDFINDNYLNKIGRSPSGAARVSPTLRLGRSVDLALHLQLVASTHQVVGLGSVGVDYFFY